MGRQAVSEAVGGWVLQWVKAVSALVRDQLFQPGEEGAWQEGSNKQKPPFREIAEAVLAKSGLGFQGEKEQGKEEEGEGSQLLLPPEPYFSPVEYLYLSSAMIQREQVSAPLTREDNPHFTVSGLDLVRLEPVRDAVDEQQEQGGMRITGPSPLPPMMAPAPQGQGAHHSQQLAWLPCVLCRRRRRC